VRLFEWLGLSTRSEGEVPSTSPISIPSRDASTITGTSALGIISVYRAVNILAIAAMQLSMDVWRGGQPIDTPPVVRRPDLHRSRSSWLMQNVTSLALTGNAYWRVTRDSRGRPVNVEVLDPHVCEPLDNGKLSYKGEEIGKREFQHLKFLEIAGRRKGLGPIQACRVELQGAVDLRDYAAEWMQSGDVPTGVLKSDQPLTPDQAKTYKEMWESRDKHSVAVLGSGLGYTPILLSPEDAQFIQSRQFTKTEIATLFGIPAHMLLAAVEGSTLTYANMSQADLSFVRWSLMGYLKPIEEAMSDVLTGLQEARFNLDGVLRPDITTRYQAHKTAIDGGWLSVDEVRAIEGLPPRNATPDSETTHD